MDPALPILRASLALSAVSVCLAMPAAAQPASDGAAESPRYLEAMVEELNALDVAHSCEPETPTRARCVFPFVGQDSQRTFDIHLIYSDDTDTVYFYVARYGMALPDTEQTMMALRRLMEINWEMLVGKLEWDGLSGEIRLSMVLNTDSNFDRRAFRSMVRTIGPLADRYAGEIGRLTDEE